jgi:hypothetical protein
MLTAKMWIYALKAQIVQRDLFFLRYIREYYHINTYAYICLCDGHPVDVDTY